MQTELEKNRDFVESIRDELLNIYPNKYIVVMGQSVIASFDEYSTAANFGILNYGIDGRFLVEYLPYKEYEPVNFVFNALL